MTILIVTTFCIGFISCGDDDDNDSNIVTSEYVGTWRYSFSAMTNPNIIVTEGTNLSITASGDMAWTLPDGSRYNAKMRSLGDGWADITFNGKTYNKSEVYVTGNTLVINVNGNANLKSKDFPFDGNYKKVN